MAELVLRLRVDPATGKRELVIDYTSEADALPVEHEEAHRRLAARVVDGGPGGALEVTRAAAPVGDPPAAAATEAAPVVQPAATRR
jgi:hypothetical protein